jgi:hypothetical protein
MTVELPPLPLGPPIPEVVYSPEEALAWLRTTTAGALRKSAQLGRIPHTRVGRSREIGLSGKNILEILAAGEREVDATSRAGTRRSSPRPRAAQSNVTQFLKAEPGRARKAHRGRKSA